VYSQLLKQMNFEILFSNLEHVLFCSRNFTYGALWLVNQQCLQTSIWSVDDVVYIWLSKVYFQCEKCSLLKEKFRNFSFKMEFRN